MQNLEHAAKKTFLHSIALKGLSLPMSKLRAHNKYIKSIFKEEEALIPKESDSTRLELLEDLKKALNDF